MVVTKLMIKNIEWDRFDRPYVDKVVNDLNRLSFSEEEEDYINRFGIDFQDGREWTGNTSGITLKETMIEKIITKQWAELVM
jgi:hypothetical protein